MKQVMNYHKDNGLPHDQCDSLFFQFLTSFSGRFPQVFTTFSKNTANNAPHLRKNAYLCSVKIIQLCHIQRNQ